MIKHVEKNIEHERAILISEKYKEFNQKTKTKLSTYDPKLRIWRFDIVERDPKAVEIKPFIKPETHNRKEKLQNKAINSKVSPTKPKSTEIILKPDSLRSKIYGLYQSGIDKKDIAKQLNISSRRVSSEITKRNNLLGLEQAKRINPTREKVRKLMKTESNKTVMSNKIGVVRSVIDYHIKKINNGE